MKKVIILAICFLAVMYSVNAQTEAPPAPMQEKTKEEKAAEKAAKEKKEQEDFAKAGFTSDEVAKVKAIMKETDDKVKVIRKDATLSDDDKKTKSKELTKEKNDKIIAIIGDEKFKAWQKAKKESAPQKP